MDTAELRIEVASVQSEATHIEFKSKFDSTSPGEWCELLKDIAAIHNSGGGVIVFGLNCDGSRAIDPCSINAFVDVATINDKFFKYTGTRSLTVALTKFERAGYEYDGWLLGPAAIPVPFSEPGTYQDPRDPKRQKTAFSKGQIYVRHGARSEPALFEDMRGIAERLCRNAREELVDRMRVLIDIPKGHTVGVIPEGAVINIPNSESEFRVTDDPSAPQVAVVDKFAIYPHRQKEIIEKLVTTARLPVNQHDILCIRRVFEADVKDYVYKPPRGSPHYSDKFADWIVTKAQADPEFFISTRIAFRNMRAA